MDEIKRDFYIYTAFLLSRGIPFADKVLKIYNDNGVILTVDNINQIRANVISDTVFRHTADNFMKYLKYLIANEIDPQKLGLLQDFFDTLANFNINTTSLLSLN